MGKQVNLVGQTFGRLTVLEKHPELTKHGKVLWKCRCSCGTSVEVIRNTGDLTSGNTSSCGCIRKEKLAAMATKHGLRHVPEYNTWMNIIRRCYNYNSKDYKNYGGRGIVVSEEWRNSFEAFYRDMGPKPSSEHSIEREDNNQNYCKENCYWATKIEQANNTRANAFYEVNGEKLTIAEIARKFSLSPYTLRIRLLLLPVDAAIDPKIKFEKYLFTLNGATKTMKEWLVRAGITTSTFAARRYNGWTIAEALEPIHLKEIEFDEQTNTLEFWCQLLGYEDPNKVYIQILRGKTLDEIVKNDTA